MKLTDLVIPPWLKLALRIAPWLIVAVLAGLLALQRSHSETAAAKAAGTISRLDGSLAAQTAAIRALNDAQVEAVATREAAQAAQTAREKAQAGVLERLSRYQRPVDGTACPNAAGDALAAEMWGRL